MTKLKLIVGLANPGKEYENTRHNAGEWFVNLLAKQNNAMFKQDAKLFGKTTKISFANQTIHLLIPQTYMNLSGRSVLALAQFYQISLNEILIAHDELDLEPGTCRLKFSGGTGGHNGLKSIVNCFSNDNNFYRLRIGIGRPQQKDQVTNYVLNQPPKSEQEKITASLEESINCVSILIEKNLNEAMNKLHAFRA